MCRCDLQKQHCRCFRCKTHSLFHANMIVLWLVICPCFLNTLYSASRGPNQSRWLTHTHTLQLIMQTAEYESQPFLLHIRPRTYPTPAGGHAPARCNRHLRAAGRRDAANRFVSSFEHKRAHSPFLKQGVHCNKQVSARRVLKLQLPPHATLRSTT